MFSGTGEEIKTPLLTQYRQFMEQQKPPPSPMPHPLPEQPRQTLKKPPVPTDQLITLLKKRDADAREGFEKGLRENKPRINISEHELREHAMRVGIPSQQKALQEHDDHLRTEFGEESIAFMNTFIELSARSIGRGNPEVHSNHWRAFVDFMEQYFEESEIQNVIEEYINYRKEPPKLVPKP